MNDTTKAVAEVAPVAPAEQQVAMPTAIALYLNDQLYDRVSSVASRMSKAQGVTPKHLVGAPEACFAVVSRAITWRLDPFAVAMATYQTPGGQIGFEGKLVHAIIENSGHLEPGSGGIRYEHYGDWSKVQGRFAIKESQRIDGDGKPKKYAAATWTDDDARAGKPSDQTKYPLAQSCGVRVTAHLRGEASPRMLDFDLIQAQPRNSTLWATDPMTQICYTAVRRFGSLVASALLMGVPFDPVDRFHQPGELDVTPNIAMPTAKTEAEPTAAAPIDVDVATGEAGAPPRENAAAAAATAEPKAAAPEATSKEQPETPRVAAEVAPMGKKASEAQRNMIIGIAKRSGLSVAQLDEHLIEKFSMGIDELPMDLVSKATQLVKSLVPANA